MAEDTRHRIDTGGAGRKGATGRARFTVPLLLLVSAAIAAWRGWGLWYRGILEHDEGHALLNASTYRHALSWALSGGPFGASGSMAGLRDTLHREGGTLYSAGKSGYSLLLAVAGLPGEISQMLALALAWMAGLVVLVATGALAYKWYGNRAAPAGVAVAGLAISPLVGALSREVSGTIWALAFGMTGLAVLAWSDDSNPTSRRRALQLIGGMLVGYGFTCHFNLAPFIAAALLAHACYLAKARQLRVPQLLRRLFLPVAGVLLVPAVFQLATWLADRRLTTVYPDYLSFAGELRRLIFADQVSRIESQYITEGALGYGADAWLYLGRTLEREGYLFVVLLVFALVHPFIRSARGQFSSAPALILFLVSTIFWIAYPFKVERVLGMCIVPAWILIAGALTDQWQMFRAARPGIPLRRIATAVAVAAISLHIMQVTITGWLPLWRQRSPIPRVVESTLSYMQKNGGVITAGSFNTGFAPVWKWTIVEKTRFTTELQPGRVDFSRFNGATVVFLDPASWRSTSREFPVTRTEISSSKTIITVTSENPPWRVSSHALVR